MSAQQEVPVPRSVRFGVALRPSPSARDFVAKVRRAEALGFAIALAPDHVAPIYPPLTTLALVAGATERIRIGTNVLNNDFHHPLFLAREAAALDLLSDGRFELGLGAGHMKHEYDTLGLRFDRAGVRVDRLTESVSIIKRLLAGETVDHRGTHYSVSSAVAFPVPDRHVPLMIGGNGRRVLQLAAREADIVGLVGFSHIEGTTETAMSHFTWDGLTDRIATARAGAPERFDQLERNVLIQGVIDTGDRRAAARKLTDQGYGADEMLLDSPFLMLGSVAERVDHVRRLRDEHGIGYITVFEPYMDATAEIIERL
jgi:probable F420-dependent oxidoreductase